MDLEALLASHDEDSPSGENLEYDPAFIEMEIAAQPGEERQAGDEILAAEDPDFSDVAEKSMIVMQRSHDIRAATCYAGAVLNTEGLEAFALATSYIKGCLEQYWESCHPELDEDDDNDPTMRINAVKGLADEDTVLKSLRRAPLTDSRSFGRISLRDIQISTGESPMPAGAENVSDSASISAAFQDTDDDFLSAALAAANQALADVTAINKIFVEHTPGQGPDLDDLAKALRQVIKPLSEYAAGDVEEVDEEVAGEENVALAMATPIAGTGGGAGGGAPGVISSPADVSAALDRIVGYYQRFEPSSPVPIILERAKRLVNADFMTIMKDMAPSGVDNVNLIGGLEDD